jgi:hypothetical protein
MIRVAFVIGGYPPEEYKRRADVARSYSTAEIEVGIVDTKASPYLYGITPAEVQLVAPAFIESFKQAEREGYNAVVPLGMLDRTRPEEPIHLVPLELYSLQRGAARAANVGRQ